MSLSAEPERALLHAIVGGKIVQVDPHSRKTVKTIQLRRKTLTKDAKKIKTRQHAQPNKTYIAILKKKFVALIIVTNDEQHTNPSPSQTTNKQFNDVSQMLKTIGLDDYVHSFKKLGYDSLRALREFNQNERAQLYSEAHMHPGHARTLDLYLDGRLLAAGSPRRSFAQENASCVVEECEALELGFGPQGPR